ncbi:unnamed protein product [Closterium sp. NIES-53]
MWWALNKNGPGTGPALKPSGGAGAGDPGAVGAGAGGAGVCSPGARGTVQRRPFFIPPPPSSLPPPGSSQPQFQPHFPLPAPSPYTEQTGSFIEHHEPVSCPASPNRAVRTGRHVPRPCPPPVPGTYIMALPPLPSPPPSILADSPDPDSDLVPAATPTVACLLATVVTAPLFESATTSALVFELVDFAAACRLDYAASLVAGSEQEDFECLAAAVPHLVAMLLAPEGDPDAPDIPTPRSYAEAIEGPYSSKWQIAMDAEMTSWKSTGTYVDAVPPPGANMVDCMWIFSVKWLPGSPSLFKARYVRDYELLSLDFRTDFLQGSLHEEIWLRRPPGFTGSFPAGPSALRLPVLLATVHSSTYRSFAQHGQLRLAYVATRANTADIFTKALQPCDQQHFCTVLGLQASAEGMAVEGAEDEGEADLAATTSREAVVLADTAATTRATDAVAADSTASATIVTRADTCGAIASSSLVDGPLLKAKRVEEQEEGEEEAVEAVAIAKHVTSTLGQRAEVKGMGKAMFKGADGKMVGKAIWALSSGSTTTRKSSLVNGGEEAKDGEEEEEEVQQVSEHAPTLPSRTTSAPRIRVTPQQRQGLHVPVAEEERRGKRRIQAPNRLTYDALGKPAKSALDGVALMIGDDEESDYEECAFAFFSPVEMSREPATLKEALESSDAEEWKKEMESELKSIEENGTWELVELPEGRKAITSKWFFKIKSDADSKIGR